MRIALGLVGVLAVGVGYQFFESYRDRNRFRPPGRIVNLDGTTLHLHEQGAGLPAVVLEAGIAGTSIGWALVQPEIAKFTTVCSYDRAGLGWSGAHRGRRTVDRMVDELAGLLRASKLPAPYILVGHSFGGLLIKAFAFCHPERVSGLVFLDPVSLATWARASDAQRKRLATGIRLSRRGAMLARLGVVRLALALLMTGRRGLSQKIGRTAAGRGSVVLERLVGEVQKLPAELWPAIRAHWSHPKSFLGMAAYLEGLPFSAAESAAMGIGTVIPAIILSAESATKDELAERNLMIAANCRSRHTVLEGSGHWLQLERVDDVVNAVRELCSRASEL